jgi:ribosomal protein L37AE/L43A
LSEQLDIFGEESGVPLNVAMKRRRSAPGWQLAPHCCKFCFGRVLSRSVSGVVIEVRCAECGEHAVLLKKSARVAQTAATSALS